MLLGIAENWRRDENLSQRSAAVAAALTADDDVDVERGWSACHTSEHLALLFQFVYDCACAKLSLPPPVIPVWVAASTADPHSVCLCVRLSAASPLEC